MPVGSWDPPLEMVLGIVGVHAVVLYTGKVLYWCFDQRAVGQINSGTDAFQTFFPDPNLGSYQVWDPTSEKAGPVEAIGRNSFCGGQCTLPDPVHGELVFRQTAHQNVTMLHCIENVPPEQFARDRLTSSQQFST
jgi:hypothetical protein